MKKLILTAFFAITLASALAFAEPYKADTGLDKIKTNLDTAKANQEDYRKNLSVIQGNMSEIGKAKSQAQKQKESVTAEIKRNDDSLKKIAASEKELQQLIAAEEKKRADETAQLDKLAKLQAKIMENQKQRDVLIGEYKKQLGMVAEEKTAWKNREGELKTQANKANEAVRTLASQEGSWISKRKSYEGEIKKWGSEIDKQQKISETYQGLKNNK